MKILYDYQAFGARYGGVSNCFVKLIANLPADVSWALGLKESSNHHLVSENLLPGLKPLGLTADNFILNRHFPFQIRLFNWLNRHFQSFPSSENINRRESVRLLKEGDFDVFHPTFFSDYFLPYLGGKPFVLTVHDMMPEIFTEEYRLTDQADLKARLCPKAAHIVAVSNRTKDDLVRILGVDPDKITVIYHAGPAELPPTGEKPLVDYPYFLYVGRRGRENSYKNFTASAREFARFVGMTGRRDVRYLCTGEPFTEAELRLFRQLGIEGQMEYIRVDDAGLRNLYANAIAFIYPSLYEGFGIPILEAYRMQCPVMLNRKSCFPEIGGDAAVYFTLDETVADQAEAMARVVAMTDDERHELIGRQNERLSLYSWEKSARQLADVYRKVLER